jgi:glycerol-3-phosphate dehydrogenase
MARNHRRYETVARRAQKRFGSRRVKMTLNKPLVVIGGGITGLGIALAAARRGVRVSLLEAGTCAGLTSANSLRIIHGGFRYLQSFDLKRVVTSLRAQREVARQFPTQLRTLPCLMPLERTGLRSRFPAAAALYLYAAVSRALTGKRYGGAVLSTKAAEDLSLLSGLFPHGALLWEDMLVDDPAALARAVRLAAEKSGAAVLEHHKVHAVTRDAGGLTVHAHTPTGDQAWTAGAIINTCGAAAAAIARRGDFKRPPFNDLRWCCAYNVVISRALCPRVAFALRSHEKRLFFAVPRGSGTAIGTGQVFPVSGSAGGPPKAEVINAFLADFNASWNGAPVREDEITGVEWGLLPAVEGSGEFLIASPRTHIDGDYIEFLSTKYTTFLSQAEHLVTRLF